MTLRLYTHGWDFYCPGEIILYHLWDRSYRPSFREVETRDRLRAKKLSELRVEVLLRLREKGDIVESLRLLLAQDTDVNANETAQDLMEIITSQLETYGLGSDRTVAEWEDRSGVNLRKRTIADEWNGLPSTEFAFTPSATDVDTMLALVQQFSQSRGDS